MHQQRILSSILVMSITLGLLLALFMAVRSVHGFAGGYAVKFDGATDRVILARTDLMMHADYQITKSVTVWVKPSGPGAPCINEHNNYGVVFCDAIFGDRSRWWGIARGELFGDDRIFVWNTQFVNGNPNTTVIPILYEPNEWVHIALVHDDDILTAYKNGVEVNSLSSGSTVQPCDTGNPGCARPVLHFGGVINNPERNWTFNGQIDELQIWDTALSETDIRREMYRTLAGTESGLAAYYQMGDGFGTSVSDDSSNDWDGLMLDGGLGVTPTNKTAEWVASGAFAGPRTGLQFDGIDAYVAIANDAPLDLSADLTIELWANSTIWQNDSQTPFLVKGENNAANYYFGKSAANALAFIYYDAANNPVVVADSSGATFADNTWYHLAAVIDTTNNMVRFYRNGRLLSQVPHDFSTTPLQTNTHDLTLGRFLGAADTPFSGLLDEVRIWSGTRSTSQLRQHMFQTLAGSENGLVAYYRFDQYNAPDQTSLYDVTANNLHGTLTNIDPNTGWVTSTAFNTWIGSDSDDWVDGRNWSQFSPPTAAANVGIPNYPNSLGAVLSDTAVVNNLYIAPDATLTLTQDAMLTVDEWLHVGGTLVNDGRIQQTKPVNGAADVAFLDSEGTYGGVIINANDEDLGDTLVAIRSNQDCTVIPGETILRCYNISPENNTDRDATITFYFLDDELGSVSCEDTEAYHWDGAEWQELTRNTGYGTDGRICAGDLYSIQVENVSDFSAFAVAGDVRPTAVFLAHITTTTLMPFGLIALLLLLTLLSGFGLAVRNRPQI